MRFGHAYALKNILPICSHCKRVRNRHGSWFPIEPANLPSLHVVLSHGICPDCARKYYPDFFTNKG